MLNIIVINIFIYPGIHTPALVPGNIYSDLMRSGILGDPYYRFNDDVYRWVHWEDWTYSTAVNGILIKCYNMALLVYAQYHIKLSMSRKPMSTDTNRKKIPLTKIFH